MVASNSAKHRMDRIIRLHEEIDQIKKDIRDIYAEEKAEGGDKTAMGEAITKIRKREKDKTAFDERENMVDVYLMAYSAPSRTHTHAREDRSDSGLNIQTKHEDIRTAPETAEELSRPAPLAGSGGDRSIPSPDAGGVKMDAVQRTPGRSDDMSAHKSAQSGQATTDRKPVSYRPNCLHPENCASGGTDHCWSCRRAMAQKEEAA